MKFFRILFVLAITSYSSVYGDTTSGEFIDVEEHSHETYKSDYTDDPVRMSVLSGEYVLYGNFEIQREGKVRLTVDDATSFSLTALEYFKIESLTDIVRRSKPSVHKKTFISDVGHSFKKYESDYFEGPVQLNVIKGEYLLFDGNLELQSGTILELRVNGDQPFTLHSIDHFEFADGRDPDTKEQTVSCIVTASNGFSRSYFSSPSDFPTTRDDGTGGEISDVTWIRFEAGVNDAKVYTNGYVISAPAVAEKLDGEEGSCIVTASNGFSQSFSSGSNSLPEILDVKWIDFEATNAKVHTEGYSITYTTADDGDEEKAHLPLFKQINSDGKNGISRKEWREYKKEDEPEVTSGNMRFRDVDENNNHKIGKGEFKKFYERLIKD